MNAGQEPATRDYDGFHFAKWDDAVEAVYAMTDYRPDPVDGTVRVGPARVASALALCVEYRNRRIQPPNAITATPDGDLVFAWELPDGTYLELLMDEPGQGRFMSCPGDDRPAKFWDVTWPVHAPRTYSAGGGVAVRCTEQPYTDGEFVLAA